MPADQAAGLRRQQSPRPLHLVYCVNEAASAAPGLARALRTQGLRPLVIDTRDRLFGETSAQTLFDWREQLAREQLLALPLAGVSGWYAPGLRPDVPGLAQATRHFDVLVLDCVAADLVHPPGNARECAWLTVAAHTMQPVYALLKTRAATGVLPAVLTGDAAACARVQAACEHFLGAAVAAAVRCPDEALDAIATLAVRMAPEEPGCQPRCKTTGHP